MIHHVEGLVQNRMTSMAYVGHVAQVIGERGYAVLEQQHTAPLLTMHGTIGHTALGRPEFLTYGFTDDVADFVFASVAAHMDAGHTFEHGDVVFGFTGSVPLAFVALWQGLPLPVTASLYGPLTARHLQVVSPDQAGRFPWEVGSALAHHPRLYPVPDEFNVYSLPPLTGTARS